MFGFEAASPSGPASGVIVRPFRERSYFGGGYMKITRVCDVIWTGVTRSCTRLLLGVRTKRAPPLDDSPKFFLRVSYALA